MANSCSASGDWAAASLSRMSSVPVASTVRPGRNLSVAGLGVGSVWMNMACSFVCAAPARDHRPGPKITSFRHCNRWRRAVEVQPSRQGVQIRVAEVPRHDRDRNREVAGSLADTGYQRSRPVLPGGGGEHQDGDVLVVLDQVEHLLCLLAFADYALWHDPGDAGRAGGVAVEHRIRLLMRLRAHDIGDAEPLLAVVVGLDHAQHQHGRADAQGTAAREVKCAVAFWRVVDDHHELRGMPGFVAAALLAHRLPRPPGAFAQTRFRRLKHDQARVYNFSRMCSSGGRSRRYP